MPFIFCIARREYAVPGSLQKYHLLRWQFLSQAVTAGRQKNIPPPSEISVPPNKLNHIVVLRRKSNRLPCSIIRCRYNHQSIGSIIDGDCFFLSPFKIQLLFMACPVQQQCQYRSPVYRSSGRCKHILSGYLHRIPALPCLLQNRRLTYRSSGSTGC